MTKLQFAGVGGQLDRRRRLLASDRQTDTDDAAAVDRDFLSVSGASAAFPMLSRDRMIRRLISPRLWKHVVVACGLIALPLALAAVRLSSDTSAVVEARKAVDFADTVKILRGLAGLELFLSAQGCLLICWVRSASAVDFRGGFRAWRWMAVLLLGASVLMLTGVSSAVTNGIAALLQPLLGTLDAARPALLLVPAGACLAFVLRYLIPDMGRCRSAQVLLVCGMALTIGQVLVGMRSTSSGAAYGLAISELLIAGLMLSAVQLHCRFVFHVNPNPPVAAMRVKRVAMAEEPVAEMPAIEMNPVRITALPVEAPCVLSVAEAAKVEKEEKPQPDHGTKAVSSGNERGKGKSSKKPLRRAG